ncbi:MAG: hypothetical protein P1V36_01280 [Planctomycetota bacterium]|nr:hypothetical protein [Planctomycetota bacterium]
MTPRLLPLALCLLLGSCGGSSGTPAPGPGVAVYPAVTAPARDPDLHAFEPFNYDDTTYPNGLSGQEGGFGFAHPWNDADGDVTDRVIGGNALGVASDMAPPSSGGRSIHWGTTSTAIFRDLDRTYGEDGTTTWVSFRWISTDATASEQLQVVDFNDATGGFGCLVGQLRGLAGDDLDDGMYDLGDHASGTSADLAIRDQAIHFVLLRFRHGVGDVDGVDCWWDPTLATFAAGTPDASVAVSDASFSRITLRSTGADSLDELYIGSTLEAVTTPAQRLAVYRIGNSLTWDSQPEGIEALAGQAGFMHDEGFHINCGNILANIVAAPAQVCIPPVAEYGTWDVALPGTRWDAVTMQPFYGGSSTLGSDEEAILTLIDATRVNADNADTRFYVYAAWPQRPTFAATWTAPVADDDDTPTVLAREYFTHLMTRVRAKTDATVYLIPVGEVLYDLDRRLQAGDVPGLTSIAQLYRDDIHLSYDLGRFVAGLTTYATLFATDPTGIAKPERWYGASAAPFTTAFHAAVNAAVWSVVSAHPHSGVTATP